MLLRILRSFGTWSAARLDVRSERGVTAVEYGIMIVGIAAAVIVAVVYLGDNTAGNFDCTADSWNAKTNQC